MCAKVHVFLYVSSLSSCIRAPIQLFQLIASEISYIVHQGGAKYEENRFFFCKFHLVPSGRIFSADPAGHSCRVSAEIFLLGVSLQSSVHSGGHQSPVNKSPVFSETVDFNIFLHTLWLFGPIIGGLKVLSNGARGGPKLVSIDPF